MKSSESVNNKDKKFQCLIKEYRPLHKSGVIEAGDRGRQIIEEARQKAKQIIHEADIESEAILAESIEKARHSKELALAQEMLRISEWSKKFRQAVSGSMVDAVMAVAERIWGESGDRKEAVLRVASELREEIHSRLGERTVRFRIHPEDYRDINSGEFNFVADSSLKPGDCIAEAGGVVFDARASVRAELSLAALREALNSSFTFNIDSVHPEKGDNHD